MYSKNVEYRLLAQMFGPDEDLLCGIDVHLGFLLTIYRDFPTNF